MNDRTRPVIVHPTVKRAPQTVGELLSAEDDTVKRLKAVAGKYLPADRALRLAITAVRRTPELAQCSPVSFLGALMSATGLGLEPNTPKQLAYLIPYKQSRPKLDPNTGQKATDDNGKWIWETYYECQFQVGYKGFVTLFYRSPNVADVAAEAIYQDDVFEHRKGTETWLRFEKNLKAQHRNDLLIGSFCFTKLKDGQSFTVMPREEIEKIRFRSQTWRTLRGYLDEAEEALHGATDKNRGRLQAAYGKALAKFNETPWEEWLGEMAAKSAIRRHAKLMTLDDEAGLAIAVASDLDSLGDAGMVDMAGMADPEQARSIIIDGDTSVEPMEPPEEDPGESAGPAGKTAPPAEPDRPVQTKAPERQAPPEQAGDPGPGDSGQRDPGPAEPPRAEPANRMAGGARRGSAGRIDA
jgi:recombination protein RecT